MFLSFKFYFISYSILKANMMLIPLECKSSPMHIHIMDAVRPKIKQNGALTDIIPTTKGRCVSYHTAGNVANLPIRSVSNMPASLLR